MFWLLLYYLVKLRKIKSFNTFQNLKIVYTIWNRITTIQLNSNGR